MADERRDIAIVGIFAYTPAGEDTDEFWKGLARGGDFITEAPPDIIEPYHFTGEPNGIDRFYCNRGGFCKAIRVDPLRYGILPIAIDSTDPDQIVSLLSTEQALMDARVFEKNISLSKCSIIIGKGNFTGLVFLRVLEILRTSRQVAALLKAALPALTDDDVDRIRAVYQELQGRYHADTAIGTMPSLVASQVASRFDMKGAAYSIDAACASGILAIEHSIKNLRSGECDIAVAGGMHTAQSAPFWGPFDLLGAVSHRGQIAPFSKDADGLLIGQGGGFLVLKTLRRALEDEDRIYAVIKETAVSSDGAGSHPLVTSVGGQTHVLKKAWERAGMNPHRIGYVEAHGTGTPAGDRVEIATLKEFFGDNTYPPALVGSVKSNIGHTMPAAGMIGVIKTALSLYHRKIPPTLHCEEPLPGMFESRFLPPQELVDWDEDRYPLVAAVNAFGFGGINAHAILTSYEPTTGAPAPLRPRRHPSSALMISALTRETLLQKLQSGDFTNTGGSYRLVLFDPDKDRIGKALSIVEKDKPWRGRMDIWFSNKPLLTNGGKVAYLCSGFSSDEPTETDSISEMLDLPSIADLLAKEDDLEWTQTLFRYYYLSWLCKEGLEKLGVTPDLYAGNSTGEWSAALFAGMIDSNPGDIFRPLLSFTPKPQPLIAVTGTDSKTAEQWCAEILDLYLSNSNCPSQILLSGTQDALDVLAKRLESEQILYTVLPYGVGAHTPLIQLPTNMYADYLASVTIQKGEVPVWSSTTLEPIPTDKAGYGELLRSQLVRPVYFRELIEKLHDEQDVRVFVQLGVGPLTGFVKETLKDRDCSVIASCAPKRDGADQLRRVLAALFVEGREVDSRFLGVKPLHTAEHSLKTLTRGVPPIITEIPELTEIVAARYGAVVPQTPAPAPAPAGDGATGNPLLVAATFNMQDAVEGQDELIRLFDQLAKHVEKTFEEPLRLTFEDHPYVIDHAIVRQPEDWDHQEDLNIVVPLTMTIELLAEIALKHAGPERKLLKLSKLNAYRWIEIEEPFEGVVRGTWKGSNTLVLELLDHLKCEFTFGTEWAKPPKEYAGTLDIGERIMENQPVEIFYDRYSFHGPRYQSNTVMLAMCSRGMRSLATRRVGKGSLLDIMGQQLGLFLHLTQTRDMVSFPVRIKDLTFYADIFDQEGEFEHTLMITTMTDHSITGDMVLKRDGKVWAVAREWVNQRFESSSLLWSTMIKPHISTLANEIAPGVYHFENKNQGNALRLINKRYLNYVDTAALATASNKQRRAYLTSRIALKDAVRAFARRDSGEMLYPIEVFCAHDENGRLSVYGRAGIADDLKDLCVSLAHKDDNAVAIAADHPVGIALARIEKKPESFGETAFTQRERTLLKSLPQPESVARFWVAKEACAKKAGAGSLSAPGTDPLGAPGADPQGDPQRFEVNAVEGDTLYVGAQIVQTLSVKKDYVIGWTV